MKMSQLKDVGCQPPLSHHLVDFPVPFPSLPGTKARMPYLKASFEVLPLKGSITQRIDPVTIRVARESV